MNASHPGRLAGSADHGMSQAVLREVGQLLSRLAAEPDFAAAVDLHGLPMDEAERESLRLRLGFGEVQAAFDAAGPTQITETAYAGVWWIRHGDEHGGTLLEQIVVARVPELLLADPGAILESSARLAGDLGLAAASARCGAAIAEGAP